MTAGTRVNTKWGTGTIQKEQDLGKYNPKRSFVVLMDNLSPKLIRKGEPPVLYFFLEDMKVIDYKQKELF